MPDSSLFTQMEAVKVSTSLLDLPAEIWSKIGRIAIDDAPAITTADFICDHPRWFQPPLTRTCRVLREELLPYFYSTRTVYFFSGLSLPRARVGVWLRALDPEMRRSIGRVRGGFCTEMLSEKVPHSELWLEDVWKVDLSLELIKGEAGRDGPFRKYVVRFW